MKNSEWNEIYFGVKEPHILQFPHVVFEPNKKNFNIVFQSIKDVPDIWGKPVPYDEKGNPTVEGADRWGFPVKSEDDVNKITDYS